MVEQRNNNPGYEPATSRQQVCCARVLKHEQSGFTLIELLVVVAIIGLLVAILLPSLAKARAQARRIQCMSQMRQQGLAMTMYAQNEKNGAWTYAPRFSMKWMILLAPYLNGPTDMTYSTHTGQANSPDHVMPVLHCPSYLNKSGGNFYNNASYAINTPLTTGRSDHPTLAFLNKYQTTLYKLKAVHSDVVLIYENSSPAPIGGWGNINSNYNRQPTDPRKRGHLGKSNFLFVDGHVEYFGRYANAHPNIMMGDHALYGASDGW